MSINDVYKQIEEDTNTKITDWNYLDCPDSGCGIDYCLKNEKIQKEVYFNLDQGELTSYNIYDI